MRQLSFVESIRSPHTKNRKKKQKQSFSSYLETQCGFKTPPSKSAVTINTLWGVIVRSQLCGKWKIFQDRAEGSRGLSTSSLDERHGICGTGRERERERLGPGLVKQQKPPLGRRKGKQTGADVLWMRWDMMLHAPLHPHSHLVQRQIILLPPTKPIKHLLY